MKRGSVVVRAGVRYAFTLAVTISAAGCSPSPITSARIEAAIERTFANLVELQVFRLGLPRVTAPDFAVTAICRRQTSGKESGSGEWTCTLVWQAPDRRTVRDTFDLFVATDGCFTASASGEGLGGPTLTTKDGRKVRNLLYAFEGCFDTT